MPRSRKQRDAEGVRASPRVCAGLAALAAGACASSEPVVLNSSFTSNGRLPWVNHPAKSEVALPPPCTISVGEVVDGRADTQSMGSFGDRYVRHENTVGWGVPGIGGIIVTHQPTRIVSICQNAKTSENLRKVPSRQT